MDKPADLKLDIMEEDHGYYGAACLLTLGVALILRMIITYQMLKGTYEYKYSHNTYLTRIAYAKYLDKRK